MIRVERGEIRSFLGSSYKIKISGFRRVFLFCGERDSNQTLYTIFDLF